MKEFEKKLPAPSTGFAEESRIMKLVCDVVRDLDYQEIDHERLHNRLAVFADTWQQMGEQRDLIEVLKRFAAKRSINPAYKPLIEDMIGKLEAQLNS
jgi:hypothetical protein